MKANPQLTGRLRKFQTDGTTIELSHGQPGGTNNQTVIGELINVTDDFLEFEQAGTRKVMLFGWDNVNYVAALPEAASLTAGGRA